MQGNKASITYTATERKQIRILVSLIRNNNGNINIDLKKHLPIKKSITITNYNTLSYWQVLQYALIIINKCLNIRADHIKELYIICDGVLRNR
jgi:hypothetical protein